MPKPKHIIEGSKEHEDWKRAEKERVAAYRAKKQKGPMNSDTTAQGIKPELKTLAIQQIVADENIQPRISLNMEDVESYRVAIEAGEDVGRLTVWFDEKIYWLSSGFTRRKSYEVADITEIPVEVFKGSWHDAWLHAKGANKHGRRFTNEEKKRNVIEMLEDTECTNWSDRKIGLHVGVDHKTVAQYRNELTATGEIPQSNTRVGKDGREYNTTNLGKKQGVEYEEPYGLKPNAGVGITWEFEGQRFYAEFLEHECSTTKFGQPTPTSRLRCRDLLTDQELSPDSKRLQIRLMENEDWAVVTDLKENEGTPENDAREAGTYLPGDEVQGKDVEGHPILGTIHSVHDVKVNGRLRYVVQDSVGLHVCYSDELQLFELEPAPESDTDGFGRPVNPPADGTTPPAKDDAPVPTAEEKAAALPLYQAMKHYGHVGHLLLSAATAWYQLEEARNKFAFAYSRTVPKHATGTVFDEMQAFLRIPDPEKWEGCGHCKGSMRVGDGDKCNSCKGGFTTHVGEGVSADVVAEFVNKAV